MKEENKNFNQKLINKRSFNFFYVRSLSFQSKSLLLFGRRPGLSNWRLSVLKSYTISNDFLRSFIPLALDEIKSILRVLFSRVPSQHTQFTSFRLLKFHKTVFHYVLIFIFSSLFRLFIIEYFTLPLCFLHFEEVDGEKKGWKPHISWNVIKKFIFIFMVLGNNELFFEVFTVLPFSIFSLSLHLPSTNRTFTLRKAHLRLANSLIFTFRGLGAVR